MKTTEHKVNELGYITLAHFLEIFGISKRTAYNWREEGIISWKKVGNKLYFKMEDVEQLLNSK